MAKTKNINNQTAPIEPEDIEEPESNGDKPKPKRPTRPVKEPDRAADDIALRKDLLARLSSVKLDDLKQLSDLPLKLIDPIAKGMAYYDATQEIISKQCEELLDWYISKNGQDIKRYTELLAKQVADGKADGKKDDDPKDKKYKSSLFRNAKEMFLPNLLPFSIQDKLNELERRKVELEELKTESEVGPDENFKQAYFRQWLYNYLLNRRSLEHLLLDGHVALTDAQILNRGEDGGMDRMRAIFKR